MDVAEGRKLVTRLVIAESLFMAPAAALAYGYFGRGVEWMLWAFVACIAGAFAVQLWFIGRVARLKKGA